MTPASARLTAAGEVLIDGEPILPPAGVAPQAALTRALQLQAAEAGQPVHATIHDDRSGHTINLRVAPNGTATNVDEPTLAAPATPSFSLPAELRHRLDAIYQAATSENLASAIAQADELIMQLSTTLGPQAPGTLIAAQVRADLAWLAGDVTYAFHTWLWVAAAWSAHLPTSSRAIGIAARNAVAAWRHLPAAEGRDTGQALLDLLQAIVPQPTSNPTIDGVRAHLATLCSAEAT